MVVGRLRQHDASQADHNIILRQRALGLGNPYIMIDEEQRAICVAAHAVRIGQLLRARGVGFFITAAREPDIPPMAGGTAAGVLNRHDFRERWGDTACGAMAVQLEEELDTSAAERRWVRSIRQLATFTAWLDRGHSD